MGGGGVSAAPVISQTTGPISKTQTSFDTPVREFSKPSAKFDLEVTDDWIVLWIMWMNYAHECGTYLKYRVSNKKATQAFGSCSRTRVPILFQLTMNIVRKMA